MKTSMNAYFFDVDGVLSGLKREINLELIGKLAHIIMGGEPLGLISGRGLMWQVEHVVKPLEDYVSRKENDYTHIIDNLFVSGEFGGVSILHKYGERITTIDETVTLPADLRQRLIDLAGQYSDIVFAETEKQTMMSMPSKQHISEDSFRKLKPEVIARCQELIQNNPAFEIHSDRFSINIKHKKADKRYATGQVVDWLSSKGLHPHKFFAFGDSISDLDIGVELYERNLPMEFVFVGRKEELDGQNIRFPYVVTKEDFDLGTLEYFAKQYSEHPKL